jgi:hypothetical protein
VEAAAVPAKLQGGARNGLKNAKEGLRYALSNQERSALFNHGFGCQTRLKPLHIKRQQLTFL